MATRCFSPPDSAFGLRSQQRAEPQEIDDARLVDEAIRGRAQPLSIKQVRFHVHVRKQQRILKHVADPALVPAAGRCFCAASNRTVSLMRIEPRCGVAIPGDRVDDAGLARAGAAEEADDRGLGGKLDRRGGRCRAAARSQRRSSRCDSVARRVSHSDAAERDDRQHDRDDAEAQRLRIAARHLGESVDRQRQRLGLVRECWIRT